jgi:hypothetical protein
MYKEELFMVIFLHDVWDKGISYEERKLVIWRFYELVKLMTKVYQGVKTQIMSIMLRWLIVR